MKRVGFWMRTPLVVDVVFKDFVQDASKSAHGWVFVDQVLYDIQRKDDILATIRDHISQTIVKVQTRGCIVHAPHTIAW